MQANLTAAELNETLKGLDSKLKAARIADAGYVTVNGKTDWSAFYSAVLESRREPVSETVEMMLHYINLYAGEYDIPTLRLHWEQYKEECETDETCDNVDAFIADHGLKNIGFYSDYADTVSDYSQDVADAFVEYFGITNISDFPESYMGTHKSEADFAEEYMSELDRIPTFIIVDWQATWDQSLRYDYTFDDATGAVFRDY